MRTARAHPQLGWLRMQARDYSRSLDRLLLERDKLNDPNYSGPAPAYLYWVANEELPQLARQPFYQQQIQQQPIQAAGIVPRLHTQPTKLRVSPSGPHEPHLRPFNGFRPARFCCSL